MDADSNEIVDRKGITQLLFLLLLLVLLVTLLLLLRLILLLLLLLLLCCAILGQRSTPPFLGVSFSNPPQPAASLF